MDIGTENALVEYLSVFDRVVEVGVGNRVGVAVSLAANGVAVTATDVVPRDVPEPVQFVVDDVTAPRKEVYADADCVYARNLPPELHRPVLDVASRFDLACCFTTLGGDPPVVPVESMSIPGDTLYVARETDR